MSITINLETIHKTLNRPITMVGLMGAGKTSVGKALAQSLSFEFVDSDDLIVTQTGKSIPSLFTENGEPYFRNLERKTILDMANQKDLKVIGTGGGAFMNDQTRETILSNTISIFLKGEAELLAKRVGSGVGRPMLKGKEPVIAIRELIDIRYPIYNEAHIIVETKDEALEETLNRVLQSLYNYLSVQ